MSLKVNKKLRLDHPKTSLTNLQTLKLRTQSKQEAKRQTTNSTLKKNHGSQIQNSTTVKSQKSKTKIDHALSLGKSPHKTQKKSQRKRIISSLLPKQTELRKTKSLQKNQSKYIFNSIPYEKSQVTLETFKLRNSPLLSHSKCYSNLTLTKHSDHIKNDAFSSFGKTTVSDFNKIKKKKHDYIKKFNKTSTFQKSHSSGFQTVDYLPNTNVFTSNFDRTAFSESPYGLQRQAIGSQVTDNDLDNVRIGSKVPKIKQLRHNVSNLFKKLKSPCKEKLLLISNNYEKIISELYTAIKRPSLPDCQISRINTHGSDGPKETNKLPQTAKKLYEKLAYFNTPFTNQVPGDILSSKGSSEHWDSYMNLNSEQLMPMSKIKNDNGKQKIIKKLDLHAIKRPDIKQYQDEFMDMKENFSESWKRQISQQTRF